MTKPSSHLRLLLLLSLMLALVCGGLVLASNLAGAQPVSASTHEAYDRVVPGMTRADDLAGIGFGKPQMLTAAQAATRLNRIDRMVDSCVAAQSWCTGYMFRDGSADTVLLVMDGRVVFKGIAA